MAAICRMALAIALWTLVGPLARAGTHAPCSDGFGRFGVTPTDGVLVGSFSPEGVFTRGATWGFPTASVTRSTTPVERRRLA